MNAMPRQNTNQPPVDPRRIIVDHIIKDCYSKYETINGERVPEIKYNTHLNAREYSQYPQRPPPDGLSPAQIGQVKSRILVVCTKHSGRVLLQKGKYNDDKRIYQIGRTWDLEELKCINRLGPDSLILLLNKDYYWRSGEGRERMHTFIHHLVLIYHKFTGRYPELRGITLAELGMGGSLKSPPKQSVEHRPPPPPPQPKVRDQAAIYRDLDFTANGKLPMKPMQVMDVDRPLKTAAQAVVAQHEITTISSPNRSKFLQDAFFNSPSAETRELQQQSLVPVVAAATAATTAAATAAALGTAAVISKSAQPPSSQTMPKVRSSESASAIPFPKARSKPSSPERPMAKAITVETTQETSTSATGADGSETDLTFTRNKSIGPTPNLAHSPSKSVNPLERQLTQENAIERRGILLPLRKSTTIEDYQAEEATLLDASSGEKPLANLRLGRESMRSSRPPSTINDSAIDSSIREIEDFMDSQFGSQRKFEPGHRKNVLLQFRAEDFEDAASSFSAGSSLMEKAATPVSEVESVSASSYKLQTDPEVDELLDEIGWKVTESSEVLSNQLTKELSRMKRKNVAELINMDYGKDKLSNEGKVSADEVSNLIYVFKKMEVGFQKIAPQISDLERNSKGLQVEAVNNKILFNDLNEILNKVKVNTSDLQLVSNYNDFDDLSQIPLLELKLVALFDALRAIAPKDSGDGLGQMKALKQYQERYEMVSSSFISRFAAFIHEKFSACIALLSKDIDNLFPRTILTSLSELTYYIGVGFFVKNISETDAQTLNDNFNLLLIDFLSKYFVSRLKLAKDSQKSKASNRLSQGFESIDGLGKRRSSRFGSTRLISRLSTGTEEQVKTKAPPVVELGKETTYDPRTIMRMVQENRELILVLQFFCCNFFHSNFTDEFSEFIKSNTFDDRVAYFKSPDVYLIDYKINSNELLQNMTAVFGSYINKFVKTFTPADLQVPQLLIELYKLLSDARAQYQDFVAYSFLRKLIDRYKNIWLKFVANNVSVLQNSDIRAKSLLLPGVKNLNVIILTTETTLQDNNVDAEDENTSEVLQMISDSYRQLTDAIVDLFGREDPLLKYNSHDEKERAHRNVAILQNLFSVLQQLEGFNSTPTTLAMRESLDPVFQRVQNEYIKYLLHRFFGKMLDFVTTNTEADVNAKKKDSKILIKALASSHSQKEMTAKVSEIHHKLERHFLTSNTVSEHDLLALMWKSTESQVVELFLKFLGYARAIDRDVDECVTVPAIRNLFKSTR